MRQGFTILEFIATLTILAILFAISIPRMGGFSDRMAVKQAANDAATFVQYGRLSAILRSANVRVLFTPERYHLIEKSRIAGVEDRVIATLAGPAARDVQLRVSRAEIRFQPTGLGWGAANTKLVFSRGRAGDSIVTSVMGRVRRF